MQSQTNRPSPITSSQQRKTMAQQTRRRSRTPVVAFAIAAITLMAMAIPGTSLQAQETESFRAHLSLVPVSGASARQTWGIGEATARLQGATLEIAGSYRELLSPAVRIDLLQAPPGFRGEPFGELEIDGYTEGTFEWTVELDPDSLQALNRGHIYIQIYTVTNPDGAIRGWLRPNGG